MHFYLSVIPVPISSSSGRTLVIGAAAVTPILSVGELLLVVLVPVRQNRADLGRVGELVHVLEVLLCQRERLGRYVGDVLSN